MVDYTDHIYNTIIIDRIATWEDFCEHKPDRIKYVRTVSKPSVPVHRLLRRNRCRYWLYHCIACRRTGIVRVDTLKKWADSNHQCKCRKTYRPQDTRKTCKYCGTDKPLIKAFWYISKAGYADNYCKTCRRAYRHKRYIKNAPWNHMFERDETGREL